MAQAKRKRRTKHRGNAAGVVESRGRTSRPPSADEQKRRSKEQTRATRNAKLLKPPTWKGSIGRAGLAAGFMFIFLLVTSHPKHSSPIVPAVLFAVFAFVLYLPAGYLLESFLYRRRLAKQGETVKR